MTVPPPKLHAMLREIAIGMLKDDLADFTDVDVAEFALGRTLGIFPPETSMRDYKAVFWTNNPLGNALFAILEQLREAGILLRIDEPDLQYRWNPDLDSL